MSSIVDWFAAVDTKLTRRGNLKLIITHVNGSDEYRCEVSADAPSFQTSRRSTIFTAIRMYMFLNYSQFHLLLHLLWWMPYVIVCIYLARWVFFLLPSFAVFSVPPLSHLIFSSSFSSPTLKSFSFELSWRASPEKKCRLSYWSPLLFYLSIWLCFWIPILWCISTKEKGIDTFVSSSLYFRESKVVMAKHHIESSVEDKPPVPLEECVPPPQIRVCMRERDR